VATLFCIVMAVLTGQLSEDETLNMMISAAI
jgi:hypothetical protein